MIVDGKVQVLHAGQWQPVELSKLSMVDGSRVDDDGVPNRLLDGPMSIAQAIEEGRAAWRWELTRGERRPARPIRVVDSVGNVVDQWPKGQTNV